MNITVVGTGYVGLVTGACFAELGHHVTCVDVDATKIANLKKGKLPIYEPGLETLVINNSQLGRLHFATSLAEQFAKPQAYFIAVGTPSDENGSADLQYVLAVAATIGNHLDDYCVVVNKSTVPVGTAEKVRAVIAHQLALRQVAVDFDVVSNPEFLKEGNAVNDFMEPDRIIVGNPNARSKQIMHELYSPFMRSHDRLIFMAVRDAEMAKYVANAMLATKISFMNEIANLCERMGVDVENVRLGVGSDSRIGYKFIDPGCGYGGSCFPKDVKALINMAQEQNYVPLILNAVEERNRLQKQVLAQKIIKHCGADLANYTIAVWGLSFKPGTDDMREASSVVLLNHLIAHGATVKAYDPVAMDVAHKELPAAWFTHEQLQLVSEQYDALRGADVLVLVTEWKPFQRPDWRMVKSLMRGRLVIDGRNQYNPAALTGLGFQYEGIGR